jgi:hypothetical protein
MSYTLVNYAFAEWNELYICNGDIESFFYLTALQQAESLYIFKLYYTHPLQIIFYAETAFLLFYILCTLPVGGPCTNLAKEEVFVTDLPLFIFTLVQYDDGSDAKSHFEILFEK